MKRARIFMTGGTSGLGFEAALALAAKGYDLTVLARNKALGERLTEAFKSNKDNSVGSIEIIEGDLSSLKSLHTAIEAFKGKHDHLDVLINNAGVWNSEFIETEDGFEQTFQVNLLAPYLLIKEFSNLLANSSDGRVITTSSGLHQGSIQFDDLQFKTNFSGFKSYRQSKLGVILITRALAIKLSDKGISLYSQHPGVVSTRLGRNLGGLGNAFFKLIGTTPKQGAETIIHLATQPKERLSSGEYYFKKKIKKSSTRESYDLKMAEKLIEQLEQSLTV